MKIRSFVIGILLLMAAPAAFSQADAPMASAADSLSRKYTLVEGENLLALDIQRGALKIIVKNRKYESILMRTGTGKTVVFKALGNSNGQSCWEDGDKKYSICLTLPPKGTGKFESSLHYTSR